MAWGGHDAIRSITSLPKDPFTEDIIYGPKYSYVIIDEKAISENMTSVSQKIALDVSTFDQYACSSPHTVFIKTKDKKIMSDFSKSLSKEMENVERILLPKVSFKLVGNVKSSGHFKFQVVHIKMVGQKSGNLYFLSF